jgi:hypothetical protein
MLLAIAAASTLIGVACAFIILKHAFRRSVGTGFMVLCIPFFLVAYAFSHFEHARKGWIVSGFLGGLVLGIVLRSIGSGIILPG